MLYLRQSTAVTVNIGPFIDDADGKTAEVALTEHPADILLAKNGGDFNAKNEGSNCTHDNLGWYHCPLDATDTGTLGRLQLHCHEAGFLPVFHEYMVLPANVYDSLVLGSASDLLDVSVVQLAGDATSLTDLKDFADAGYDPATNKVQGVVLVDTTTTNTDMISAATVNAQCDTALSDIQLDHLVQTDIGAGKPTDGSLFDQIMNKAAGQTFDASTDSLEAVQEAIVDSHTDTGTLQTMLTDIHDTDLPAVKTDTAAIHTVVDNLHDTDIPDIHTDVGTAITDIAATHVHAAAADTQTVAATIADAIHDEVVEGAVTFRESTRLMLAALAGKTSEVVAGTMVIRDVNDTADRLTVTMDANRYRTGVVVNP